MCNRNESTLRYKKNAVFFHPTVENTGTIVLLKNTIIHTVAHLIRQFSITELLFQCIPGRRNFTVVFPRCRARKNSEKAMTTSQTTTVPGSTVAARPSFKDRYDHYIGGRWAPPESGDYFDNISPIDGKVFSRVACGNARDIEKAIDAAHAAFPLWSKSSGAYRHDLLLKIAEVIAANQD